MPSRRVRHLDVVPGDAVPQAGPQRFQKGFLGGKTGGIAGGTIFPCRTVGLFLFGENALQQGGIAFIHKTLKSLDGDYIGADA